MEDRLSHTVMKSMVLLLKDTKITSVLYLFVFISVGIVCAAPVMDSWYRAQLINFYPEENEADLRFMDYGGYARTDASCLRQIRSDFLSLPFQAVECYLANIVPLQGKYFNWVTF